MTSLGQRSFEKTAAQVSTELPNIWAGGDIAMTVVIWLGIITLASLISTGGLTLGKSVVEYRADNRRRNVENALRPDILERSAVDEPSWNEWVRDLSQFEIDVTKDILMEDLRILEGHRKQTLRDLAFALDLPSDGGKYIRSDNYYRRLRGLQILNQLETEVNPETIRANISNRQSEREASAHLLAKQNDSDATKIGLEMLLQDKSMTIYGLEGLHQLIGSDPTPALNFLSTKSKVDDQILSQLLLVLGESGIPEGDAPIDGVLDALTNDDPLIRKRACRVLGGYGWNEEVRESVDVEALVTDSNQQVRVAAYLMLDEWGDEEARRKLAELATREPDEEARVQIARALQGQQPKSLSEVKALETFTSKDRSWAVIRQVVAHHHDPLK